MYRFFSLLTLLLLISCGSKTQQELDALEAEVMRIHDESMLGMSDLKAMQRDLAKIDASKLEDPLQNELIGTRKLLAFADSLMWDWMHNYSAPDKSKVVEAKDYLNTQLVKINRVDQLMSNSIEAGDKLYKRIPKELIHSNEPEQTDGHEH